MENNLINVADYAIKFLYSKGVSHAFQVPGGGAMFLNDAVEKSNMISTFCHHEQACAMSAVGYTKASNKPSLVVSTSGCGSTNTITGLLDAWQDSHPVIFISGQANKKDTTFLSPVPLRKLGVQEVNIIEIVKSITKFSTMLTEPEDVAKVIEEAFHIATSGRPGPVWIDIPLDIQNSIISESLIEHWVAEGQSDKQVNYEDFKELLLSSKRPIVVAGNGIRLANAEREFRLFVEKYNLPCVFTFLASDLLEHTHPLNIGRMGIRGTRAGNFAIANSDLVLSIGSSLSIPAIGFNYEHFAREAKKVVVDVDKNEHSKQTIKIDLFIESDAKDFLYYNQSIPYLTPNEWTQKCIHWREKWNIFDREDIESLNMYSFSKKLSELTTETESVIVADAGSAYYVMAQSAHNSRIILPGAQGEMGFTIPASIGAALALNNSKIFGVTGDGSFQFNIQELQTIVQNNLPIKIIVLNNNGYLSIKNTQKKYFEGRLSGTDKTSGISFPECSKIANAYGMKYFKISKPKDLDSVLPQVVDYHSYCICEVICPEFESIIPAATSGKNDKGEISSLPLEYMSPLLTEKEFASEMIVNIIGDKK